MRLSVSALCLSAAVLLGGCDAGNDQPEVVATNDTAQTSPGQAVTIHVLANDTGSDLAIESFQERAVRGGRITRTEGDALSYRPGAGFLGTDSFTYVARDGAGVTSKNAIVTVVVQ